MKYTTINNNDVREDELGFLRGNGGLIALSPSAWPGPSCSCWS